MRFREYLVPFFMLLLLAVPGRSIAQQNSKAKEPVYLMPDEKPQFPDGNAGIQAYFEKKIDTKKLPERKVVTVSLLVTKTGAVQQAYIGKGISPEIDSAVIKAARSMSGWKPGKMNGNAVNSRVLFPVVFSPPPIADVAKSGSGNPASTGSDAAPLQREVYQAVEQVPAFPGGERALHEFFKKNLVYPAVDKEKDIKGTVVIQFVVETSGALTEFSVLKSLSETTNKEAIRVMKLMPPWEPGRQNGRNVAVRTLLVIRFPPGG
jgi:TonB family protein